MSERSTKRQPAARRPHLGPHPDDAKNVAEAFDERRRGDLLSVEESAEYLRQFLGAVAAGLEDEEAGRVVSHASVKAEMKRRAARRKHAR